MTLVASMLSDRKVSIEELHFMIGAVWSAIMLGSFLASSYIWRKDD